MEQEVIYDRHGSIRTFESLAFVFGVISLAGLFCCFPIMFVFGGLGILFASLSRGSALVYSAKARQGLIFSIIGTVASIVLTVGIFGYSTYSLIDSIKKDPGYVEQMRKRYEEIYDSAGLKMSPEMEESFDMLENFSNQLRTE